MDMTNVELHFDLLGLKAKDVVTEFEGVVECISFDLYGCVQVVLKPKSKDGVIPNGQWFDISRIKILSSKPVMALPNFERGLIAEGKKGPAAKPLMISSGDCPY